MRTHFNIICPSFDKIILPMIIIIIIQDNVHNIHVEKAKRTSAQKNQASTEYYVHLSSKKEGR